MQALENQLRDIEIKLKAAENTESNSEVTLLRQQIWLIKGLLVHRFPAESLRLVLEK